MEHKDIYNQTSKTKKGITTAIVSVALAGALLVGGVKIGSWFKKEDTKAPVNPTPETTTNAPVASELVLTEDFDINDPAAVTKRAQDIYNLSQKEKSVLDIQNSINVLKMNNIVYPDNVVSDDDKFKYLQKDLNLVLEITMYSYISDYIAALNYMLNDKTDIITIDDKNRSVPCAYMWMPQDSEAKRFAIEIAKNYYEQRANIRNNNLAAAKITANDYYDLFEKWKNMDLSVEDNVAILYQFYTINAIYTSFLSKEQAKDLDNISGYLWKYVGNLYDGFAVKYNLSISPEDLNNGSSCKSAEVIFDKYKKEQAAAAEQRVAKSNEIIATETGVVNQGGTPASGSAGRQEVINDGTTKVSTSEFVAPIPNEGTSENIVSGGEVVEEHTTEPVTEPSETPTYVDDENIPVMSGEEYAAAGGRGMMLLGSLGAVFSKKRKNK